MNYVKSDKSCGLRGCGCFGASHCDYYKERPAACGAPVARPVQGSAKAAAGTAPVRALARGSRVVHTCFGAGSVVSSDRDRTRVIFESVGEKTFLTASLSDKKLFSMA